MIYLKYAPGIISQYKFLFCFAEKVQKVFKKIFFRFKNYSWGIFPMHDEMKLSPLQICPGENFRLSFRNLWFLGRCGALSAWNDVVFILILCFVFERFRFSRWAMQKSRHFFRFQKIPQFHLLVLMKKIPHFLDKLDLAFLLIPN